MRNMVKIWLTGILMLVFNISYAIFLFWAMLTRDSVTTGLSWLEFLAFMGIPVVCLFDWLTYTKIGEWRRANGSLFDSE